LALCRTGEQFTAVLNAVVALGAGVVLVSAIVDREDLNKVADGISRRFACNKGGARKAFVTRRLEGNGKLDG
jgi:hypothetical protein